MTNVTLKDVTNILTGAGTINENSERIEAAFQRSLSRVPEDGSNQMETLLDMNQYPIINLPKADRPGMPVTYDQLDPGTQEVVVVPVGPDELTDDPELLKEITNKLLVEDGGTVQQAIAVAATPSDLLASTVQYKVGSTIRTADGFIYEVADPDASDHHLTTAGGVKLYVVPDEMGAQPYKAWAQPSTANVDNTESIQRAINSSSEVTIPAGDWRVDGSIDLYGGKTLTFAPGARLMKLAANGADTNPLIYMRQNYTQLRGARLYQTTNAPEGVLHIGAKDQNAPASEGDHLWWKVFDPWVEANNVAGTLGIVLDSNQKVSGKANYFGAIYNPLVRYADVPIQLRELCNGHQIFNPQIYMARTYAIELRGAYGNNVYGGFLHGSHNGVIGVALRKRVRASDHESINNIIDGFNIEPGGVNSKPLRVEEGCSGNTVLVKANVAGSSEIFELSQNIIDTRYGTRHVGRMTQYHDAVIISGAHNTFGRSETKRRPMQTGIPENTAVDLFRVQTNGPNTESILNLVIQARNPALGRGSAISVSVRIYRNSGSDALVGTPVGLNDGNAGTLSFVVSGAFVTVRFTTANNGTSTTSNILAEATLHQYRDEAVHVNNSLLTVL